MPLLAIRSTLAIIVLKRTQIPKPTINDDDNEKYFCGTHFNLLIHFCFWTESKKPAKQSKTALCHKKCECDYHEF